MAAAAVLQPDNVNMHTVSAWVIIQITPLF